MRYVLVDFSTVGILVHSTMKLHILLFKNATQNTKKQITCTFFTLDITKISLISDFNCARTAKNIKSQCLHKILFLYSLYDIFINKLIDIYKNTRFKINIIFNIFNDY